MLLWSSVSYGTAIGEATVRDLPASHKATARHRLHEIMRLQPPIKGPANEAKIPSRSPAPRPRALIPAPTASENLHQTLSKHLHVGESVRPSAPFLTTYAPNPAPATMLSSLWTFLQTLTTRRPHIPLHRPMPSGRNAGATTSNPTPKNTPRSQCLQRQDYEPRATGHGQTSQADSGAKTKRHLLRRSVKTSRS